MLYFFPSLRAKYGTSDLKNALHGSESFHAAEREIKFMFPNSKCVLLHSHILYVGLNTNDSVPHMVSLCSCNRTFSLKRSNRRIPEQVCKPNSATWTHWALQAQATQPLCKYYLLLLPCCLLALSFGPRNISLRYPALLFSIDLACWLADQKWSKQASNMWWSHCGRSRMTTGRKGGWIHNFRCYFLIKCTCSVLWWNKMSFQHQSSVLFAFW